MLELADKVHVYCELTDKVHVYCDKSTFVSNDNYNNVGR